MKLKFIFFMFVEIVVLCSNTSKATATQKGNAHDTALTPGSNENRSDTRPVAARSTAPNQSRNDNSGSAKKNTPPSIDDIIEACITNNPEMNSGFDGNHWGWGRWFVDPKDNKIYFQKFDESKKHIPRTYPELYTIFTSELARYLITDLEQKARVLDRGEKEFKGLHEYDPDRGLGHRKYEYVFRLSDMTGDLGTASFAKLKSSLERCTKLLFHNSDWEQTKKFQNIWTEINQKKKTYDAIARFNLVMDKFPTDFKKELKRVNDSLEK